MREEKYIKKKGKQRGKNEKNKKEETGDERT
jgi:hypothetical protein